MSFPRYPAYKDTGVAWLGRVPEHWGVAPFKRFVQLQNGADYKDIESDDGYPVIGSGGPFAFATKFMHDGESVLLGRKGTIDKPLFLTGRFWTVDTMYWTRIASDVNARFCYYAALIIPFGYYATNTALPSMTKGAIHGHLVCCPTLSEQVQIAAFLDHETAKIDALIGEQQRLIELLNEKRQAVISHAVTKGLNPNAPMKPSGVEWLGDMPEHWALMPLKRNLLFLTSGSRGWADHYADDGDLFLRITNLTRGSVELDLSDIQRVCVPVGAEGARTLVQAGDVLFSITAYLGSVAVVPEELETAYVSQHVALARLRPAQVHPKWVGYVALSSVGKTWFEQQSYGGTKIQLSLDDVRNLPVPVPPVSEQLLIVAFVDSKLEEFGRLKAESLRAIDVLQERRSALISAAVTGQIDVRGFASQEAA